jgi:O-antigen/teichoic acid export membrane protein
MIAGRAGLRAPNAAPPDSPPAPPDRHTDILATAKGSGILAVGSLFEFASRFVIALLLARSLGAADYGLYVMAVSAAALFSGISQIGLDDAMVRYVAILSGRRDDVGLRGALQLGIGVSTVTGVVLGAILYLGAAPIASGLFDEPRLAELLRLVSFLVPFLTVSNVLAGVARGFRRMEFVAIGENGVQSVVRMVLVAIIVLAGDLTALQATLIFGVSDVAATATLVVLLDRAYPLRGALGRDVRRDAAPIFRFALPLWLSGLLRQFRNNIQTIILGATGAISGVGVYAVVDKVNLVSHVWLLSVLVAVKPTLARLHDRGDHEGLARLYSTATRWTLSLYLPFFACTILYREQILGVFGPAFAAGSKALVVLAVAELANAATGVCGPMVDMTGHTRVKLMNSVLWTALLIGSGAWLIPRWGIVGAALSALIAIATVNALCVLELWMLERLVPFDRTFVKPVVAGAGAFAVGLLLAALAPVDRFAMAALQGVAVFGSYAGIVLLLGLETEDRLVLDRSAQRLRRVARRAHRRAARGAPLDHARARGEVAMTDGKSRELGSASGPVFVGGLDRSGKSTMSAFLTSHSQLAIPTVGTNMWTYFYRRYGDLRVQANFDRCLDAMLRYSHIRALEPDAARIRAEFVAGPRTYARLFALFHVHDAERQAKPRWGAQTGLVERYADQLFAAYPGVKVIHMVRDPRDRYEGSLALWPAGRGGAGAATARWRYSTRLAVRNRRRYPGRYIVVRFEDLVLRPEDTLRDVCDFVGEAFEPTMLQMPGAHARRDRLVEQSRRSPADPLLSSEFIGRYHGTLEPRQLAFMQLHAGPMMRMHGYEPDRLAIGAAGWARFAVLDWPDQMARMLAWRGVEAAQQRLPSRVGRRPDRRTITRTTIESAG